MRKMLHKMSTTKRTQDINVRIKRDLFKLTVNICIIAFIYLFALFLLLNIYFESFSTKTVSNSKVIRKKTLSNIKHARQNSGADYSIIDHGLNYEQECYFENDACFNLRRCLNFKRYDSAETNNGEDSLLIKLKVFVYHNPMRINDTEPAKTSKEFKEFIETILDSEFYEPNPDRACIFVPFVDLLNEKQFNFKEVEEYFHSLD